MASGEFLFSLRRANSYELIEETNYILENGFIQLNETYAKNIIDKEIFYLLNDKELIEIEFNILTKFKPHVLNAFIYTDLQADLIIELDLRGASFSINKEALPEDRYTIADNIITINKSFISDKFLDSDRESFILGITFIYENNYYLNTIHIYKN